MERKCYLHSRVISIDLHSVCDYLIGVPTAALAALLICAAVQYNEEEEDEYSDRPDGYSDSQCFIGVDANVRYKACTLS